MRVCIGPIRSSHTAGLFMAAILALMASMLLMAGFGVTAACCGMVVGARTDAAGVVPCAASATLTLFSSLFADLNRARMASIVAEPEPEAAEDVGVGAANTATGDGATYEVDALAGTLVACAAVAILARS